ncbi:MAG TPA: DUF177 domain-containing protein [Herpetosiphonaceae bacterium]
MSEFRFSVSQLLQEPTGATRQYELDDAQLVVDDTLRMQPVAGRVRLTRTPKGILADATVRGNIEIECGRCLTRYQHPLSFKFSEQYYQTVNVTTGARLPQPEEDDAFLIDETHKLDLGDAMREYALLNLPAAPRCQDECKGLCQQCGKNLNEDPCGCETETIDDRFAVLNKLLGEPRSNTNH